MAFAKENRHEHGKRKQFPLFSIICAIFVVGRSIGLAEAGQPSPAHHLTDGRPWKMTTEDGRVGTLVLFEDGTGKMTGGAMELSPKWRPTADGICLKPAALLPERCVKLVRSDNGYVGLRAGKRTFRLER